MKKLLLFFAVALASTANAQTTCANATQITLNGTYTTPAITGTYVASCLASDTNIKAVWYKYTPTANGEVTISSNLADNDGVTYTDDTRISVMTGACGALVCSDSNDDVASNNYLSTITVPVQQGVTYYFQWDNYWQRNAAEMITYTLPLKFTFTFTAVSCIRIGAGDFYLPDDYTATSATLYFDQSLSGPANYQADWSNDLDAAPGTGTIVSSVAGAQTYSSVPLAGLPAGSNFRFYVRANCGATQSAWQGPNYGYLAVPATNYTNSFENADKNFTDGFIGSFSLINTTADSTPASYADGGAGRAVYTFNSTTAVSDRRSYTRGFVLAAGETVTFKFKSRLWTQGEFDNPSPMIIGLSAGLGQSAAAQTINIQNFTLTSNAAYTQHSASFTAPAAGTYFFGFHNKSAMGTTQTFAFIDTIETTSVLSVDDFQTTEFAVSPNPAENVINITNNKNILVNNVSITDLNGRIVKQVKYADVSEVSLNIADLSSGMYLMTISSDKGSAVKKIIKK